MKARSDLSRVLLISASRLHNSCATVNRWVSHSQRLRCFICMLNRTKKKKKRDVPLASFDPMKECDLYTVDASSEEVWSWVKLLYSVYFFANSCDVQFSKYKALYVYWGRWRYAKICLFRDGGELLVSFRDRQSLECL